jgi:DNA-binding SARP family transcriptional activator
MPIASRDLAEETGIQAELQATAELDLLQSFELRKDGEVVQLPQTSQRVIAFLAVHERALQRPFVSGSLWPDVSDGRADGSLRSAIWRLRDVGLDVVTAQNGRIRLSPAIRVDVARLVHSAHQLAELPVTALILLAGGFESELLPDWYDDWILDWRERWRQIRFHALEEVAGCLIRSGDCGRAIEVGLAAVRADPLRESAHRVVIKAHLAEGNPQEAVRQFRTYEHLVQVELGIEPSPTVLALVEPVIRR